MIMKEFKVDKDFSERMNTPYFYDRLYYALVEDGNEINYGIFHSKVLANGVIKVLKALSLYKTTGARETKKTYIHSKVLLIYNTTVADNETISKTLSELFLGKYIGIDKLIISDYNEYNTLNEDYTFSIDGSKCTYIIYNPENNLYKIGRAKDVYKRYSTLCTEHSMKLKFICFYGKDVEGMLHKEYAGKRVFGEWFLLNMDDILDIKIKYDFKILEDLHLCNKN